MSVKREASGGTSSFPWKPKGCGLGLRHQHYPVILETWPKVDWFEAISENFMDSGGRPIQILEKVRAHYPIALHGTALSIGSADNLNKQYLSRLKQLVDRIDPFIVSDHLCWSGVEGEYLHDLLPLPFTEEALKHVVRRVEQLQEYLGRTFVLENVSTYLTYRESEMKEWEFLAEVSRRSGCGLLVDLNNVHVNAVNHHFDPLEYIRAIPAERVAQIHLAGHTDMGSFLFDTHSAPVIDKVWELYKSALGHWGQVSTLIEWDEHIPSLENLIKEADKAKLIYRQFENKKPAADHYAPAPVSKKKATSAHVPLKKAQKIFKSRMQAEGTKNNKLVDWLLNPQGGSPASERINVYANGYPARVHEAISEVFEAVRSAVGPESFEKLAYAYAQEHAPKDSDYNLNYVGRDFEKFLKKNGILKSVPYAVDLAHLEWLVWQAFHAFDTEALTSELMAKIPPADWEKAKFTFQPSVSTMKSEWEIFEIWKHRHDAPLPKKTERKTQYLLVGRSADKIRVEVLHENAYFLLNGLLAGRKLGAVCGQLAEKVKDPSELEVSAWFGNWISQGLIQKIVL